MLEIAVFRHNLFRVSEPFIAQQAQQLRRYKPLYIGRMRFGPAPPGATSLAIEDLGRGALPRIAWQMISRDPRPYLRLLNGRRPALIHAHFGVEGVSALPLAKRLGVPLVTTFHGFDATLSTAALLASPAWANYALFRHKLAERGDLFLCTSSFIRERVIALGFPEARTRVHYIGVDSQAIRPRDPAEEAPMVLSVGRLVEVKGTEYLIRAFAALAPRPTNVELVIVGEGALKAKLAALAESLGIGARVRFLGSLLHADVIGLIRKAAMMVLPSVRTRTGRVEGLGMVLLEAAASGVPLIASRSGGIPEVVIDGQTGYLTPERDTSALAARMNDLLDDRDRRIQLGAQARALVERQFDLATQTMKLEDLYDGLLTHGS